jgi:ATP-dependent DNA ligase
MCAALQAPGVLFSEGVAGSGKTFYQAVVAQGHEGVMAKRLAAPYGRLATPSNPSKAWPPPADIRRIPRPARIGDC